MSEGEKPKFPRTVALAVLDELIRRFDPEPVMGHANARVEVLCAVGGFRRGKTEMKDLEVLYVPRVAAFKDPADMFGHAVECDLAERAVEEMLHAGVIGKRLKVDGSISAWGRFNKHAVHVESGLPIDLFATTRQNYFNRLVVTTGPAELNVRIAATARRMGWEWEVGEGGFVPIGKTWETATRERRSMRSEADVFQFVEMPFLRPWERR